MQRLLSILLIVALPIGFAGCAAMPAPQTPNERMVVLEYGYQAALQTVSDMMDTGLLAGEDRGKALDMVTATGVAVRAAREAVASGATDMTEYIVAANTALTRLIVYLNAKKDRQA